MPKRLSDITHLYERTAADLEQAEDNLTTAMEDLRSRVETVSRRHREVANELSDYLRDHPDEVVVANDHGYHYDPNVPGSIRIRPIFWAHHVWVEDPPAEAQPATYRVPIQQFSDPAKLADAMVKTMATAWGLGTEAPEESTP